MIKIVKFFKGLLELRLMDMHLRFYSQQFWTCLFIEPHRKVTNR